jgi:hypothetical protein
VELLGSVILADNGTQMRAHPPALLVPFDARRTSRCMQQPPRRSIDRLMNLTILVAVDVAVTAAVPELVVSYGRGVLLGPVLPSENAGITLRPWKKAF